MNIGRNELKLYLVTDRKWLKPGESLPQVVEAAVKSGVTCVQLREKRAEEKEFLQLAFELKDVCKKYNVPFIINDNVEVALAIDADGVHIGQSDMALARRRALLGPDKIIGTSAHNVAEALQAAADGADYIGCGAVFGSQTKTDAGFLGVDRLKEIRHHTAIPMVAIGGITAKNLPQLYKSGIDGVAVVSRILAENDIAQATKQLREMTEYL